MVKVAQDGNGLPVVHWVEGSMAQRFFRTSFIERDAQSGEMSFVHECVDEVSGLLGIVVGIAAGLGTVVVAGLVVIFIANVMQLRAGTAMDVATAMLYLIGIAAGVIIGRKAKAWFAAKGYGRTVHRDAAPWAALEAFTVTDDQTYFGKARQKDGKPVQSQPVILAYFRPPASPVCVSYDNWAQSMIAEIHRTLTNEFIERRSDHLNRMAGQNRNQRDETAGPREKRI